jgi:hypothetical protein
MRSPSKPMLDPKPRFTIRIVGRQMAPIHQTLRHGIDIGLPFPGIGGSSARRSHMCFVVYRRLGLSYEPILQQVLETWKCETSF